MKVEIITTQDGKEFPVLTPNTTIDGDGFYISYNDYDLATYGSDTTALVFGQMQAFYVLNGDHRENYLPLINDGFGACLDYFKANIQDINKYSEKPIVKTATA